MTKSWRPEGWENPHIGNMCPEGGGETCEIEAYEAGADAMLEALFEMAKASPTGTFIIDSKEVNIFNG